MRHFRYQVVLSIFNFIFYYLTEFLYVLKCIFDSFSTHVGAPEISLWSPSWLNLSTRCWTCQRGVSCQMQVPPLWMVSTGAFCRAGAVCVLPTRQPHILSLLQSQKMPTLCPNLSNETHYARVEMLSWLGKVLCWPFWIKECFRNFGLLEVSPARKTSWGPKCEWRGQWGKAPLSEAQRRPKSA